MEEVIQATNETVTENLIAGNKEHIVGLWDDKIRELRRDKHKLEAVHELKFLPNTDEFTQCVNKIHLRDCLPVEYNKRREPVVTTGRRGAGEGDIGSVSGIAVDREMDLVYVSDFVKHVICVYSLEGDFVREFDHRSGCAGAICLSKESVFVSNAGKGTLSITKFSKDGLYLSNTTSMNRDFTLESCSNLCTYNDQTLYVCNFEEEIIEIFTFDLTHTGNFGKDEIHSPKDIKIHEDTIFVLEGVAEKIHTYNTTRIPNLYSTQWIQSSNTISKVSHY